MDYAWRHIAGSGVISNAPCNIGGVIVTSEDSDDNADCTLYDGESASDPKILKIRSGTGTTKVINFQPYLKTQRGLYIAVGSDVDGVLVQLISEKE